MKIYETRRGKSVHAMKSGTKSHGHRTVCGLDVRDPADMKEADSTKVTCKTCIRHMPKDAPSTEASSTAASAGGETNSTGVGGEASTPGNTESAAA